MSEMKKLNDQDLAEVTGGLRNVDQLKQYIRTQKANGVKLNTILNSVMSRPNCDRYLDPVYASNGTVIGMKGAGDLQAFTEKYYYSLS